jgi:hypothetical protein
MSLYWALKASRLLLCDCANKGQTKRNKISSFFMVRVFNGYLVFG